MKWAWNKLNWLTNQHTKNTVYYLVLCIPSHYTTENDQNWSVWKIDGGWWKNMTIFILKNQYVHWNHKNHEDVFVFLKSIYTFKEIFIVLGFDLTNQASLILLMTTIHQLILKVCVTRFLCNTLYINCFSCRRWHSFVRFHAHTQTLSTQKTIQKHF